MNTLSDVEVELIDHMGSDKSVVDAARVSTRTDGTLDEPYDPAKDAGLINYLMRCRHGTPFEHNSMTFFVKAPIFVFREFHRHRVGWSYNEMSGRYTELPGDFYMPVAERPMVNVGSSARPRHVAGDAQQYADFVEGTLSVYQAAWGMYKSHLGAGVTKELARIVLPVGIYSQMHATCNARSLMAFLSLRTEHADATFPSHPQYEIQLVADKLENHFAMLFPDTYAAFVKNGRVGP